MSERFIKYIPSEKADWLRKHYRNAFALLSLIAENARRTSDHLDGLQIGDAILGNYEDAGLTRKEYRNAKNKLIELEFIEVVWNPKNKNLQKRAIKRAIKSEVVCLINSEIWDINPEINVHQMGHQGAIKGPQTRTNKNEEEVLFVRKENEKRKEPVRSIRSSDRIVSFPSLQKEEKVKEILEVCSCYQLDIGDKSIQRWLERFGQEMITELLSSLIDKKAKVRNHEAWMEKSLQATLNFEKNKQFISLFISKHNITYIIMTKNYCRDVETENDYQFSLPHEQFVEMITRKHESKRGLSLVS